MNRIFIRCEDKNEWERRTPVVPEDIMKVSNEVSFVVEKSAVRCIEEEKYVAAGCRIGQCDNDVDIIVGIKEIPEEKIAEGKIYVFFSHCVKGQKDGIHLLQTIMDRNCTLIDYEKITDQEGKRLIAFGKHAGYAGAVNALWLYGKRLKRKRIPSSFQQFQQAIHYSSVNEAMETVRKMGETIRKEANIFEDRKPIVIGILGTGKVATGALEIFDCLGGKRVAPHDLAELCQKEYSPTNQIFICIFSLEDLLLRKDRREYSRSDYRENPHLYESRLGDYLPYITILANGLYWDEKNPTFLSWDMLEQLYKTESEPKLRVLSDITCDMYGTLECNIKYTSIMEPYYYIEPFGRSITDANHQNAIAILAEENYPAEFSLDASRYFSSIAVPLFVNIAQADFTGGLNDSGLIPEIKSATVAYHGKLTEKYKYLEKYFN